MPLLAYQYSYPCSRSKITNNKLLNRTDFHWVRLTQLCKVCLDCDHGLQSLDRAMARHGSQIWSAICPIPYITSLVIRRPIAKMILEKDTLFVSIFLLRKLPMNHLFSQILLLHSKKIHKKMQTTKIKFLFYIFHQNYVKLGYALYSFIISLCI